MDGSKESKRRNTILGGIGSSIWNLIPKFKSEQSEESFNVIDKEQSRSKKIKSSIDLDKSDSEDECSKLESKKRIYNTQLINELRNERAKRGSEMEDVNVSNVKRARLNISVNNSSLQFDKSQCTDQIRSSFSYRSICTTLDTPITRNDRSSILHNSDSTQSLSVSMNEPFQNTTASRITANLFSHRMASNDIPRDSPRSQSRVLRTNSPYSQGARRYRTIMKKDTISSYLSRESIGQETVLSQTTISAPTAFNLNNVKDTYRFDMSQLRKPSSDVHLVNKERQWKCEQCGIDNPISFNFCPSCANANPLTRAHSPFNIVEPHVDTQGWKCLRCSTFNTEDRNVCFCCFMGKLDESRRHVGNHGFVPGLAESLQRVFGDSQTPATKTNTNILNFGKLSKINWSCPTCMTDNDLEEQQCVSCQTTKPGVKVCTSQVQDVIFGNSCHSISQGYFGNSKEPSCLKFGNAENECKSNESTKRKWECPDCMVENLYNANKCVCCNANNPNGVASLLSILPPSGRDSATKWNCPTCFVDNTDAVCVCCSTKNPNETSADAGVVFGQMRAPVSNNSAGLPKIRFGTDSAALETKATSTFVFGSNAKSQNSAPITFGANSVSVSIEAPRPSASSKTNVCATGPKWECTTCMVENDALKDECACCSTKRTTTTTSSLTTPVKLVNGPDKTFDSSMIGTCFGTSMKWQCPTCLAENGVERQSCACCMTKNPADDVALAPPSLGNISHSTAPSFIFGQSTPSTASNIVPSNSSIVFGSLFGTSDSLSSSTSFLFGQTSALSSLIGQTSVSSSLINQTSAPLSLIGQTSAPSLLFGQTSAPSLLFGQTSAPSSLIGQISTTSSLIGQTSAPSFLIGQTSTPLSLIGQTSGPSFIFGTIANPLLDTISSCLPPSTLVTASSPVFTFGLGGQLSKLSNGLDKVPHTFTFGAKKECSSEDQSDCLDFSFSKPKGLDYESNVDLDGDMEFEFSSAEAV